jgi:hypothetical protein
MLERFALLAVAACAACGGTDAPLVVDAGNGCIVTRPAPSDQQCIWSAVTSSAGACGTERDASVDAATCTDFNGNGCFSTDTCQKVCGMTSCQPDPQGDPTVVKCGNYCM